MKATKLLLATLLLAGLTSLSFAGTSPEYQARFEKERAAARERAAVSAKTPAAQVAATCACCNCAAMKKS